MKSLILGSLLAFTSAAFADPSVLAQAAIGPVSGQKQEIKEVVKVFNQSQINPESSLATHLKSLVNANNGFTVEFAERGITANDVIKLESGLSGPTYYSKYLILIRAGFKSNNFPLEYLEATFSSKDQGTHGELTITGPIAVEIKDHEIIGHGY